MVRADRVGGMLTQIAVTGLTLAQHDFHLFASRDFLNRANKALDYAGRILDMKSDSPQPFHCPARADNAEFFLESIRALQLLQAFQASLPAIGLNYIAVGAA